MQRYLSWEWPRCVFSPNHCGKMVHLWFVSEHFLLCGRVWPNIILHVKALFLGSESSSAVTHLYRSLGWSQRTHDLFFCDTKQKRADWAYREPPLKKQKKGPEKKRGAFFLVVTSVSFFGGPQLDFRKGLYITLTFGEEIIDERCRNEQQMSFFYLVYSFDL